jgi:hypothetical protein
MDFIFWMGNWRSFLKLNPKIEIFSQATRTAMRDIILSTDQRWSNTGLDQRLQTLGYLRKQRSFPCSDETAASLDLFIDNVKWNDRESVLPFVRLLESAMETGDTWELHSSRLDKLLEADGYKLRGRRIYRLKSENST